MFILILIVVVNIIIVNYCKLLFPLSTWLCVTVAWVGAGAGAGVGGGARGWVADRVGFWGVLATWVWGRQLQHLSSWAPNLHVRLSVKSLVGLEND